MVTIGRHQLADGIFRFHIVWDDSAGNQQSIIIDTKDSSLQVMTMLEPPVMLETNMNRLNANKRSN